MFDTLSFNSKFSNHYLGIPLMVGGIFGEKKVKFFFTAGAHLDFLFAQSSVSKSESTSGYFQNDKKFGKPNETSRIFNITPTVSLGIDYALSEKMHLRVAPITRFTALNTNNSIFPKSRYINMGVNISYFMKL